MFGPQTTTTADSFGAGLVLDTETGAVNVVLIIGYQDNDLSLAVPMAPDETENVIETLKRIVNEARIVQKAVETMPPEAAKQYLDNWAARQRGALN